jgi:hypothetical protein
MEDVDKNEGRIKADKSANAKMVEGKQLDTPSL